MIRLKSAPTAITALGEKPKARRTGILFCENIFGNLCKSGKKIPSSTFKHVCLNSKYFYFTRIKLVILNILNRILTMKRFSYSMWCVIWFHFPEMFAEQYLNWSWLWILSLWYLETVLSQYFLSGKRYFQKYFSLGEFNLPSLDNSLILFRDCDAWKFLHEG